MKKIEIYDSTLRDGAQMHKISYSNIDRLKIVKKLDEFGIDYIEAGNPGSNPKEKKFFEEIQKIELKNSHIVAFGSTRRAGIKADEDENLKSLVEAKTKYVNIYGKAWDFQVTDVLKTSLEENLKMISSSIKYLIKKKKEVFFDAEHFYDGYKSNPEYALKVIKVAIDAGATRIVLCDTNGGCLTTEIANITKLVCKKFKETKFGIHCHNDMDLAVANSIIAIDAGVVQVQGTINGFGERCGNANLCTLIPTLILKKNVKCLSNSENLTQITEVSKFVDAVANCVTNPRTPYVGDLAFTHKAGAHINAINKNSIAYEHVTPDSVGNSRKKLISELAGKSAIYEHVKNLIPSIKKDDERLKDVINEIKIQEKEGLQFEDAPASMELVIAKKLNLYNNFVEIISTKIIVEEQLSVAIVKIKIDSRERLSSAEGKGPVDALNKALRKAIGKICPNLIDIELVDYKVRAIESSAGSDSKVIVNLQTTNKKISWNTVGVSTDVVQASMQALIDSIEYAKFKKLI